MKLILTHRPIKLKSINVINAITRAKTQCPFDHVAAYNNGIVYESTFGKGVHKQDFDEWKIGRDGSYLTIMTLPKDVLDLEVFDMYEGRGYDVKANLLWLTNQPEKLKKRPTDKFYCSELIGAMAKADDFYEWTPARCVQEFIDNPAKIMIL